MRGLSDRVILCDWKTSPNPNPKLTLYVEDKLYTENKQLRGAKKSRRGEIDYRKKTWIGHILYYIYRVMTC